MENSLLTGGYNSQHIAKILKLTYSELFQSTNKMIIKSVIPIRLTKSCLILGIVYNNCKYLVDLYVALIYLLFVKIIKNILCI